MKNTRANSVALTTIKGGIDRLRTKGGAKADSLYELLNAYVTERGTVKPRPGTIRRKNLTAGTVGLVAFNGCLHVFATAAVDLSEDVELVGADWTELIGAASPPTMWDGTQMVWDASSSLQFLNYTLDGEASIKFTITIDTLPSSGEVWFKYAYDAGLLDAFEDEIQITETGDTTITIVGSPTEIGYAIADFSGGQIQENGLGMDDGEVHVRAFEPVTVTPCFEVDVIPHPSDTEAELVEIHFAAPFLGALYVVAEFDSGEIFHYWLQDADPWSADTEYSYNQLVQPIAQTGLYYRATRYGNGFPAWAPGVARTEGNGSSIDPSIVEPTVYNEYYYTAIQTGGDNPRSGAVEPTWPVNTGQTIVENTDGFEATTPDAVNPPAVPTNNSPQSSTTERYT